MKHFIYLNTDILNSFLSQINDGIINRTQSESYDSISNASNEAIVTKENKMGTDINLGFLKMNFTETPEGVTTTNALTQCEYGKELIEKIFHDNSFQQFINYLNENELIKELSLCDFNDYVHLNDNYSLKDLDYLLDVYTDEYIDFYSDQVIKNLNITSQAVKQKRAEEVKSQKNIRRIFNIARTMLPTSKFIYCSNCLIPLDDKYLRESSKSIRFNYTGKINVIGRVVSTLERSVSVGCNETSNFGKIFESMDEVNKMFYNINLGIPLSSKIIIPIALYFE